MADEIKPDQKSTPLAPPKDIEELLKELPKINSPTGGPKPLPPTDPMSSQRPIPPQRPSLPSSSPPPPKPLTLRPPPPLNPPPKPALPAPQEDRFKSLVRTMDEDLEVAKKGMKPESKPFEIKLPPGGPRIEPPPPLIPPSVRAQPMTPEIKLGPSERTKLLEIPKPLPPLPPPGRKFAIRPRFLITVLLILAVFAGAWFFLTRESEEIIIFTPTPAPTPMPKTLSQLIPSTAQITISLTENFLTVLNNKIKTLTSASNNFTALELVDENGNKYTISDFFERLQITPPGNFLDGLDSNEWTLVLYGQQETFDAKGLLTFGPTVKIKIGLIAKTISPESSRNTMNSWETTITGDLDNLFGINPKKATNETFLDNIYSGTNIRYKNFPYADNSIDYAIVNLSRFNLNYFVLTNSRESIYSAIDLLQNQ